jgi:FkbM family methyltransferase
MGPSLTTCKLLLMAAASSRLHLRKPCLFLLRPFVRDGNIAIRYSCEGRPYKVFIRMNEMSSDFQSVLELVVGRVYWLDKAFSPDLVVDCGGNIGLFSLTAAAVYPSSRIVTCEPVPGNLERIRKHLEINGVSAEILPVCIGGSRRRIPFFVRQAISGSFDPTKPYTSKLEVEVWTLADVLASRDAQKIQIKLDIEGMEIETLESYVPVETRAVCIVGELHEHKTNQYDLQRIFADNGWELRFSEVTNQGSVFVAHSPAALTLKLNRSQDLITDSLEDTR